METQKTPNSQSNLEKEKWSWKNQAPGLQTILQSYSNQDSMVLEQKQNYRSVEQDKESKEKTPCLYGQSIFGKGTQNLQWGKDSFFNKQCGKTGQLHAKE